MDEKNVLHSSSSTNTPSLSNPTIKKPKSKKEKHEKVTRQIFSESSRLIRGKSNSSHKKTGSFTCLVIECAIEVNVNNVTKKQSVREFIRQYRRYVKRDLFIILFIRVILEEMRPWSKQTFSPSRSWMVEL
jgi:hypothetical protein